MDKHSEKESQLPKLEDVIFSLDVSLRFFFRELATVDFLKLVNAICHCDYPLDSEVVFLDTDGRDPKGPSAKYHIRGDLVAELKKKGDHNKERLAIEFQSFEDPDMGMRMFVYAMNVAKKENHSYLFQKSMTIYLTNRPDKEGYDEARLLIDPFHVENEEGVVYTSKPGDFFVAKFPFLNVLAMDWAEFQKSPLELLKILYAYRYIQKENLMKKDPHFIKVMEELDSFVLNENPTQSKEAMLNLWNTFSGKLLSICMEKPDKFKEELDFMKQSEVRRCDVLRAEGRFEAIESLIQNAIGAGKSKNAIIDMFQCSEELYQKIYNQLFPTKTP